MGSQYLEARVDCRVMLARSFEGLGEGEAQRWVIWGGPHLR